MSNIHPNTVDYYCLTVKANTATTEQLMALLGLAPFSGFQETDDGFLAYWPEHLTLEVGESVLAKYQQSYQIESHWELVKQKNWNAVWESNFTPITVGDFCMVRAPFHDSSDQITHDIVIEPKMAFGTGHHATTFMMMQKMHYIAMSDKSVLDFGCGTGILAILADKLGAAAVFAIDNDPLCYENTKENTILNQSNNIHIQLGDEGDIPEDKYDVILANINLNVILSSLEKLYRILTVNGDLLISGILLKDKALVLKSISSNQFNLKEIQTNKEWICLHLTR